MTKSDDSVASKRHADIAKNLLTGDKPWRNAKVVTEVEMLAVVEFNEFICKRLDLPMKLTGTVLFTLIEMQHYAIAANWAIYSLATNSVPKSGQLWTLSKLIECLTKLGMYDDAFVYAKITMNNIPAHERSEPQYTEIMLDCAELHIYTKGFDKAIKILQIVYSNTKLLVAPYVFRLFTLCDDLDYERGTGESVRNSMFNVTGMLIRELQPNEIICGEEVAALFSGVRRVIMGGRTMEDLAKSTLPCVYHHISLASGRRELDRIKPYVYSRVFGRESLNSAEWYYIDSFYWEIIGKREKAIDSAMFCVAIYKNLFNGQHHWYPKRLAWLTELCSK